jgi:hypothetical protein
MENDASRVAAYREARRDFIAAAEAAGGDVISRVHPAKGPDGKPLFCDSVALGPRDAFRALLLMAGGKGAVTSFLRRGVTLPKGARLVAVHALDPFFQAWGEAGASSAWPEKTLSAIATEDLSRVKNLIVLDFSQRAPKAALEGVLPKAALSVRAIKPEHAEPALIAAIAAL